jgi:outer membrane protein
MPDGRSWSIDLRFPLFTGGLNRSRIQQSVYTHRAATEALERIARQTERQTRDAYLGVISEIQRVRALRQAVESSRTALRATEAGFEVGTQTTVDVLASQNNLRRVETTYSRSRYDYILNILRLKQAAGSLAEADVQQVDGWLQ